MRQVILPAAGHVYDQPVYEWVKNGDTYLVTARAVCKNDPTEAHSHTVTETVTASFSVITEAGCETEGAGRYVASFTQELFTEQTMDIVLPAAGHVYGFTRWTWMGDDINGYSKAEAVFTCRRDETHTFTVSDEALDITGSDPTFKTAGEKVYTATAVGPDNETYTDTKIIVLDKYVATRMYGDLRFDTALLIAEQIRKEKGMEGFDAIIVASGSEFADALSGSYLAYVKEAPILLASKNAARMQETADYIKEHLNENGTVYILGGEAAVSPDFEAALGDVQNRVKRLAGKDRYLTNIEILKEAGVKEGDEILISSGKSFADSLSASSAGRPVLLVKSALTNAQEDYLSSLHLKVTIIGGEAAVTEEVEASLQGISESMDRLYGSNRFETSIQIAKRYFPEAEALTLVYSHDFPDGLSAGPYAALHHSPVVLCRTAKDGDAYAAAYAKELSHLKAGYVTGGPTLIEDSSVVTIFDLETADDIRILKK